MGWIASFGVAVLTGILGMFGAATVAALAAAWYNISSFEGGSGFFVVGIAILGLFGGFVIGLVGARFEASQPKPRFAKAMGISSGAVAVILTAIAVASWMLADIPPQIDGEELFLQAELRWPASGAAALDTTSGAPFVRLGATNGSVIRRLETGPLLVEDARKEDGRTILPGVVRIFTSRGGRTLHFGAGDNMIASFFVPLPRYPREAQRQWSAWLPSARAGEAPLPDQFTYRFRVIRQSESIRTETIGPFDVDTVANYFYNITESDRLAARSTFRIRYRGQPIPEVITSDSVAAVVGGPSAALFTTVEEPASDTPCALVIAEGNAVRVQKVKGCGTTATGRLLTSDEARFVRARTNAHVRVPGWVDRTSFAEPGLFQFDEAVVDTRTFAAAQITYPSDVSHSTSVPPLDLSPDENSFVWLAADDQTPRLGVTNWRSGRSYLLPIDRARMRYSTDASLDPDWVRHHFEWQRDREGGDVLAERVEFVPLPYRGDLTLGKAGAYHSYALRPGGEPLRKAIVNVLVSDLGAELVPDDSGGYRQSVRVKGKQVDVSVIGSPSYVYVSMSGNDSDPQLMAEIAASLDKALASGRYDALFVAQ
jgi:hypothetical protein